MVVRFNPGAFFPLETYSHLNVDSIRQLVEDVNVEVMQKELAQAIADNELMRQPFANLIVHLLANNHDQEALDVTKRLHTAFAKQPQTTPAGWPNAMWSQLLGSVAPFAVALEKWEYFYFLTWTQQSDSFILCGLFVTAAQVSIAKEWLEKGKEFLLEARKLAEVDQILGTEAIDHLIGFVDAKLRGEDVNTAGLFMSAAPQDEEDLSAANDFDWAAAVEKEYNPDWAPYDEQLNEQEKILRRWQLRLGGRVESSPWTDADDLAYVFQRFRPDGDGLEEFCSDLGCGEAMMQRLLEIFRATRDGYSNDTVQDRYFVVHKPVAASDEELRTLAEEYVDSISRIACAGKYFQLMTFFQPPPTVSVMRGILSAEIESGEIQSSVYRMLNEYIQHFPIYKPNVNVLSEALYTMANDHILAHYVVWPVAQRNFDHEHEDPYGKYFELWKRGAQLHYTKAGQVVVCCSLA